MEIIVVILAVIFAFVNAGSKAKKKQAAARGPAQPVKRGQRPQGKGDPPGQTVRIVPKESFENALNELQQKLAKGMVPEDAARRAAGIAGVAAETVARAAGGPVAQGASMLEDPDCAGGSMAHTHDEGHSHLEDEDCFGGSMEHTHTEGVSRAAVARRMAAIDAFSRPEDDLLPRTIDAAALKRAVVMAEVLGKPRALRKT